MEPQKTITFDFELISFGDREKSDALWHMQNELAFEFPFLHFSMQLNKDDSGLIDSLIIKQTVMDANDCFDDFREFCRAFGDAFPELVVTVNFTDKGDVYCLQRLSAI